MAVSTSGQGCPGVEVSSFSSRRLLRQTRATFVTLRLMEQATGRPRDPHLEGKLLDATEELLLEGGYAALTIDAIVSRAGTSRPAFYRRFSGVPALLLTMLFRKFGGAPEIDTGTLEGDLLAIQREQVRIFSNPLVLRSLAGFLDSLHTDPALTDTFHTAFFAPRRAITQRAILQAVSRAEVPMPADLDLICDLLSGPFVMRATFPRLGPIDESLARATVTATLSALRDGRELGAR